MMKSRTISLKPQYLVLILASVTTFLLRFVLLDRLPLTNSEAINALQALTGAQGGEHLIGGEAGYVLLTTAWFFLFGAGDGIARFWPALAGAALALTPWLFRRHLGEKAALLLCFGLAVDAGWTAVSRQAHGMTLAGLFIILALAALVNKKSRLLGVLTALALLGGPAFWLGAIGLGAAYALYKLVFQPQQIQSEEDEAEEIGIFEGINWKTAGIWFGGAALACGTLLFIIPNGLNSVFNGFAQYFINWSKPGDLNIWRLLLGFVISQPIGFLFGAIGLLRMFRSRNSLDIFLAVWWLTALALVLLNPGREMIQAGWASLPILALASRQLAGLLTTEVQGRWTAIAYSIIVVVLLVFAWLNFIAYFQAARPEVSTLIRVVTTIFPVLLLIGAAIVIRWFWSEETAGQGALWGLVAVLALWSFSAAWGNTGLGANPAGQIWRVDALVDEVDLLKTTVNELSTWKTNVAGELELVVEGIDSPALRWALRDYSQIKYVTSTASASSPAMLITGDKPSPELAETYRGQDFVLEINPSWQMSFDEWLQWAAYKKVPVSKTMVVLWARADLFPDAAGFNP
ncbi:MAG TPA: hypothetical protein VIH16_12435 [Bellilinea sp.]